MITNAPKIIPMTSTADGDRPDDGKEELKPVTLRGRDIRAAKRLLNALVGEGDGRAREITTLARGNVLRLDNHDRSILAERARKAYVSRARRSQIFNAAMFGEAAWDMLLALYATDLSGARHTVSGLVSLSGVPPTTALRWLEFLEAKEELVCRRPNPLDARVGWIALTDKGRELLDAYFSGTASEEI